MIHISVLGGAADPGVDLDVGSHQAEQRAAAAGRPADTAPVRLAQQARVSRWDIEYCRYSGYNYCLLGAFYFCKFEKLILKKFIL